jgi:hypothetical protein
MPNAIKAPTVRVLLLDLATGKELKSIFQSEPLGNYSFDHFTGYSPPISVKATGINCPNTKAVIIALEVTNNQRNLQIPVDDLAKGFDIHVGWSSGDGSAEAVAAAAPLASAAAAMATAATNIQRRAATLNSVFGSGQVWAKKQPNGAAAALLINHASGNISHSIVLAKLNLTGSAYSARDIWNKKDLGTVTKAMELVVAAYDSAFVLFTPK